MAEAGSRPLVSVLVPTRDRAPYLASALAALARIPGPQLEVLVRDQSAAPDPGAVRLAALDPRIVYVHDPDVRNHVEHFHRTAGMARGDYVCLVGDDDGVLPAILDAAALARDRGLDAVHHTQKAAYYWPGVTGRWLGDLGGTLLLRRFTGTLRELDPARELRRACARPGHGLLGLPRLYHGLVRRGLLEAVQAEHGSLFRGVSPDLSSAVLIAHRAQRAALLDYPFTVPGACAPSSSGRGAGGTHFGPLRADPHMRGYEHLAWPPGIPEVFSVETVWAEAAWEALCAQAGPAGGRRLALARLNALFLLRHPGAYRPVARALAALARERPGWVVLGGFAAGLLGEAWARLGHAARRLPELRTQAATRALGLPDIAACVQYLQANFPYPPA